MAESTSGPAVAADPGAVSGTDAALQSQELTLRSLLESGAHFGHQTRRWDPRMKQFIFGERNGIHILDLDQTLDLFTEALEFIHDTVAGGGKILFVGTKRQAQAPIRFEAERSGQYYVNNRWLGGMLTNYRTVRKSVERFKEQRGILDNEEKASELSKRDRAYMARDVEKYRRSLEGIQNMGRLPDVLFVIDVGCEHIAISEARRLGIPIVAVVDTNCSPDGIDFVIPGNDDAIRAIQLYCARVADAAIEGAQVHNERLQSQAPDGDGGRSGERESTAPSTGRVVVEIKHPPRRGRGGTHSAGGPRSGPGGGARRGPDSDAVAPPEAAPEKEA
jgi:small subunit ribosomal protein S2